MEERYIKAIDPDKWVRPAGWLQMPTITSSQNKLAFLFAVYADEENCFAIAYGSTVCNYLIDWGDGTTLSVVNSNTTREKRYNYSAIASIVLQDSLGINYKQVVVTVTLNSGTPAVWNMNPAVTRGGKAQILESVISHNNNLSFGRTQTMMQSLKIVKLILTGGVNSFFSGLIALRNFEGFVNIDTTATTTSGNVFSNMGPVWQALDFTWNSGASAQTNILSSCRNKRFGNMTFNGSGGLNAAIAPSPNLEEIGTLNTDNHNALNTMFQGNFNLQKIGTITANGSALNITGMFQNCYSLQEIVFADATNVTTITSNTFINCFSLRRLVLPGITQPVSITNACMQRTALVELFTSLGTPGVLTNLTITGNPGIPDLTAAELLIATSKNWTVIQ